MEELKRKQKKTQIIGLLIAVISVLTILLVAISETGEADQYGNTSKADKEEAAAEAAEFASYFGEQTFAPTEADLAYLEVLGDFGTKIADGDDHKVWEYHGAVLDNEALLHDKDFMNSFRIALVDFGRLLGDDGKSELEPESEELLELDAARWEFRALAISYVNQMDSVFEGDYANFDTATEHMYEMLNAMDNMNTEFYSVVGGE